MSAENISAARSQKLWAVLLVLDSFFVIIFGGALAAKIYQHWQAPAAPLPAPHRRPRPPKAAEAPKPQPPAPPAAAEPPKPAEPTAPAKHKNPEVASSIAPPKPSLIQEAPRRETAQPQEIGAVKAVPVEFRLQAPDAKEVEIGGAFLVRGGGKKRMVKTGDGLWKVTLYLTPNTYRYYFLVDGKKTLDPQNQVVDRNASVLAVTSEKP